MRFHRVSIDVTANTGVSWSVPTLTEPSLAATIYTDAFGFAHKTDPSIPPEVSDGS
jgi:hypothetical protein